MGEPEPIANVTRKISQLSVSSKPKKSGGKASSVGAAAAAARRRTSLADMFKYRGWSWPEVVGMDAAEAEQIIKQGKPELYVSVVPEGQMMTMSYGCHRVRLVVDKRNRVLQVPTVG